MASTEQEELLWRIKFAEQMERYEDAIDLLNDMIKRGIELGYEGRNLLSVAYKSVLNLRRYSWRVLAAYESKPGASESEKRMAKEYRAKVDEEYRDTCNSIISLLDQFLIPKAVELESEIYLLKMKADYYRYLAEITFDEKRVPFAEKSMEAYDQATELANQKLKTTHPLRMGLALNYAVYYYEIKKDVKKACNVAEQAYAEARPTLVEVGSEETKERRESLLILQLLQENLTKWAGTRGADEASIDTHRDSEEGV